MVAQTSPTHRVSRAVAGMRAAISDVVEVPLWSMTGGEAAATLIELTRLEAQTVALKLRVLAQVDESGYAAESGMTSTAHWYAHTTRITQKQAHREVQLAAALDAHAPTASAFAAGQLHLDQAAVVLKAVDDLPDGLDPQTVTDAEVQLVEEATRFDAKHLRVLGRHLVEVAAPEIAEAHTARLLEREERQAAADQRLVMYDDSHGRMHGSFTLDAVHGAMLKKALLALAAPKHRASSGPLGERKPTPERLGEAFAEYIASYPAEVLPDVGGLNATVVVTMTMHDLQGPGRPATLDTGETISAAAARKLACEAGIITAVLGSDGAVLDLGRRTRLFTAKQRLALALRDKGCTAEGCDYPPAMCHAHHHTPWSRGGPTDLANGRLLCPFHHARAHDTSFQMTELPDGRRVAFHRRT